MTTYSEKLRDPRWQKRRLEILNRDDFMCRDCGSKTKSLQVHHCFYAKGGPWNTSPASLITLCFDCHQRREAIELKLRESLGDVFASTPVEALEQLWENHQFSSFHDWQQQSLSWLSVSGGEKQREEFYQRVSANQELEA